MGRTSAVGSYLLVDRNNLQELRKLIDEVIYSPNKVHSERPLRKLEFLAAGYKGNIDRYAAGKLTQTVGYAKKAAGQARNKDHWISNMERAWYTFESIVIVEEDFRD